MESGGNTRGERRSSAALIVSILALAVASGGTAAAVGGLDSTQTKAVKAIADKRVSGHVRTVFKPINNGAAGALITKGAGFAIRGNCTSGKVEVYLTIPDGATADGVSDSGHVFGHQSPLYLTDNGGNQVSSFAVATKDGRVISGNLGFDFPQVFNHQDKCVAYGHVLVN